MPSQRTPSFSSLSRRALHSIAYFLLATSRIRCQQSYRRLFLAVSKQKSGQLCDRILFVFNSSSILRWHHPILASLFSPERLPFLFYFKSAARRRCIQHSSWYITLKFPTGYFYSTDPVDHGQVFADSTQQ